jgi:hypothetical protein
VQEFCIDRGGLVEFPAGTITDPKGHPSYLAFMVRGSSWQESAARAAFGSKRVNITPATAVLTIGFRVCLEIPNNPRK